MIKSLSLDVDKPHGVSIPSADLLYIEILIGEIFDKIRSVPLIPHLPNERTNPKSSLSIWTIISERNVLDYTIHPLDRPIWYYPFYA